MKYLLIGLAVSIGWHVGMLLFEVVKEVVMTNLHATDWYAVLCKKKPKPNKQQKPIGIIKPEKMIRPEQIVKKETEPYRGTNMGFRVL